MGILNKMMTNPKFISIGTRRGPISVEAQAPSTSNSNSAASIVPDDPFMSIIDKSYQHTMNTDNNSNSNNNEKNTIAKLNPSRLLSNIFGNGDDIFNFEWGEGTQREGVEEGEGEGGEEQEKEEKEEQEKEEKYRNQTKQMIAPVTTTTGNSNNNKTESKNGNKNVNNNKTLQNDNVDSNIKEYEKNNIHINDTYEKEGIDNEKNMDMEEKVTGKNERLEKEEGGGRGTRRG